MKKNLQILMVIFLAIFFIAGCGKPEEEDKIKVTLPANNTNNQTNWQIIYQDNIQSVPMIVFEKCYVQADYCTDYGHGTGAVITDNVVVTNYHVAEFFFITEISPISGDTIYYQLYARYPANNKFENNYFLPEKYYVTAVHSITSRDLALLKVTTLNNTPIPFALDNFNDLRTDDPVMHLGYPGFSNFVGAEGKIGDLFVNGEIADWVSSDTKLIEYTSATNRGSSGGPVLNIWGEVIGINFAYYVNNNQKIPFAISIDHLRGYDFANLVFETP